MAKLVLHIGGHKTGTSYLQSLFWHNRALLQTDGIHYPKFGANKSHHVMAGLWMPLPDIPKRLFGPGGAAALWDGFIADYAGQEGTVFLSAENFSRLEPKSVDMRNLAARLAAFEQVQVVYTARHQVELVQSVWLQIAKTRRAFVLRNFVEKAIETAVVCGLDLDHGAVYARLLHGFAPAQITVLDYASFRHTPGGMVQVFLDLLGSRLRPQDFAPTPPDTANISPDPLSMYVATLITEGQIPPPDLIDKVEGLIRPGSRTPTTLLMRGEYARIGRAFARKNTIFVNKIKVLQSDFSFDPVPPPDNLFYRDDLTVHHWAAIAAALYRPEPTARTPGQPQRILKQLFGKNDS